MALNRVIQPRTSPAALPRPDWASAAALSGFVATIAGSAVFTLAYGLSEAVGTVVSTRPVVIVGSSHRSR